MKGRSVHGWLIWDLEPMRPLSDEERRRVKVFIERLRRRHAEQEEKKTAVPSTH